MTRNSFERAPGRCDVSPIDGMETQMLRTALILIQAAAAVPPTAPAPAKPDIARLFWQQNSTRAQMEEQALAIHQKLDENLDGYVTIDEVRRAMNARVGHSPQASDPQAPVPLLLLALIEQDDIDHDGRVSAAEAKAGADREFDLDDTDHDGVVTPEERWAGMLRFGAEHPDLVAQGVAALDRNQAASGKSP